MSISISQQEPFIKAVCVEITDSIPPNLELPNLLAKNIKESIVHLSEMEKKLSMSEDDNDGELNENDEEMRRRINIAKLDDKFYDDLDDDEDLMDTDRVGRFQKALKISKDHDTNGYHLSPSKTTSSSSLSAQDLTAISW